MARAKFWMVTTAIEGLEDNVVRGWTPHASRDEARKEAERLAEKYPSRTFFVLESVGEVKANTPVWKDHFHAPVTSTITTTVPYPYADGGLVVSPVVIYRADAHQSTPTAGKA